MNLKQEIDEIKQILHEKRNKISSSNSHKDENLDQKITDQMFKIFTRNFNLPFSNIDWD